VTNLITQKQQKQYEVDLPMAGKRRRLLKKRITDNRKALKNNAKKTYLTIAFRNLRRKQAFGQEFISGLSLGIFYMLSDFYVVVHSYSFDRFSSRCWINLSVNYVDLIGERRALFLIQVTPGPLGEGDWLARCRESRQKGRTYTGYNTWSWSTTRKIFGRSNYVTFCGSRGFFQVFS